MAAVVAQHLDAMDPAGRIGGTPYALLSNDNSFTGGWLQRTLLATFNTSASAATAASTPVPPVGKGGAATATATATGGTRELYSVVKKPDLAVMSLLTRLGTTREHANVSVGARTGGGAGATSPAAVATRPTLGAVASRGASCVAVLLFRSDDTAPTQGAAVDVAVHLRGAAAAAGEGARVAQWQLDATHGNPHAVWEAAGSPAWPSDAQLAAMEREQEPVLIGNAAYPGSGPGSGVRVRLPLPGVALVQVCNRTAAAPHPPAATVLPVQLDGNATVVHWSKQRRFSVNRVRVHILISLGPPHVPGGEHGAHVRVDQGEAGWPLDRPPPSEIDRLLRCCRSHAEAQGSEVVQAYSVLCSVGGAPYVQVASIASRCYLHRHPRGGAGAAPAPAPAPAAAAGRRCYKVVAIDYWQRASDASPPACTDAVGHPQA